MALTREQIKSKFNAVLAMATPEKQANASELLTELSDEFESVLTASEESATKITELTSNNETLRAVNAKLFLRVGETDKEAQKDDTPKEEETPSIKFEDLFNEKGELI